MNLKEFNFPEAVEARLQRKFADKIKGLDNKNTELLGKLIEAKAKIKELEKRDA